MRYPSWGVGGGAVWPGNKDWRHGYLKPGNEGQEEREAGPGQVTQRSQQRTGDLSQSSQEDTGKAGQWVSDSERRIFQEGRRPRTLVNAAERAS